VSSKDHGDPTKEIVRREPIDVAMPRHGLSGVFVHMNNSWVIQACSHTEEHDVPIYREHSDLPIPRQSFKAFFCGIFLRPESTRLLI